MGEIVKNWKSKKIGEWGADDRWSIEIEFPRQNEIKSGKMVAYLVYVCEWRVGDGWWVYLAGKDWKRRMTLEFVLPQQDDECVMIVLGGKLALALSCPSTNARKCGGEKFNRLALMASRGIRTHSIRHSWKRAEKNGGQVQIRPSRKMATQVQTNVTIISTRRHRGSHSLPSKLRASLKHSPFCFVSF